MENQIEMFRAAEVTRAGLVLKESATIEDWRELGETLDLCGSALQWWLGDWAIAGESRFGQKIAQLISGLDTSSKLGEALAAYSLTSIYEIIKTCRAWPLAYREPTVGFMHHAAVATRLRPAGATYATAGGASTEDKETIYLEMRQWIKVAKEKNLTVKELLLVMSGKQLEEASIDQEELFEAMLVAKALAPQVLKLERSFGAIKSNISKEEYGKWSDQKRAEVVKQLTPCIKAAEELIGIYLSIVKPVN